jgi:hypothetical protein
MKDSASFFNENKIEDVPANSGEKKFQADLLSSLQDEYYTNLEKKTPMSFADKIKLKFANKTLLYGSIIFVIISILFVGTYFYSLLNPKEQVAEKFTAKIEYLEGRASLVENTESLRAEKNMELPENSSLILESNSRAIINIGDDIIIRVGENTKVDLVSLNKKDVIINQFEGEIYVRTLTDLSETKISVVTDDAKYTSTSTAYRVIDKEAMAGVEVYHSKVNMEEPQKISILEGEFYYIRSDNEALATNIKGKLNPGYVMNEEFVIWNKNQDKTISALSSRLGFFNKLDAPMLEITKPNNEFVTKDEKITIEGRIDEWADLTINGRPVSHEEGKFSHEVDLIVGENKFTFVAKDILNNETKRDWVIIRESEEEEPELTITPSVSVTVSVAPTATPTPVITLTATTDTNGINLSWTIQGFSSPNGFRILKSESGTPRFPESDFVFIPSGNQRSYSWSIADNKRYFLRICQNNADDTCGVLSNTVEIVAPE